LAAANNDRLYRCKTAGDSGGMEPMWSAAVGSMVPDNTTEWEVQFDPLAQDPDDSTGLFSEPGAFPDDTDEFEKKFHSKDTYHAPLIVSAGADGELGLLLPTDTTDEFGDLAQPDWGATAAEWNMNKVAIMEKTFKKMQDSITNLNQRAGTAKKK
jgi:hypothetical protein